MSKEVHNLAEIGSTLGKLSLSEPFYSHTYHAPPSVPILWPPLWSMRTVGGGQ